MFTLIWLILVRVFGEGWAIAHCELLSYAFMRLAFDAVIMIAILTGLLGPIIVGGRQVFLSHTLAHSSFAGLAIGVLLNLNLTFTMFAVLILLAFAISAIRNRSVLSEDTAVGIGLSAAVAGSLIIISKFLANYKILLFDYMFGSILGLEQSDIILLAITVVFVGVVSIVFYNKFCFLELSPSIAKSRGVNIDLMRYLVVMMIAIVVAVGIKLVGIILLTSLFVVPTAAARIVSRSMRSWTGLTVVFTAISGVSGLLLSYYFDFPASASIIAVLVLVFALISIIGYFKNRMQIAV